MNVESGVYIKTLLEENYQLKEKLSKVGNKVKMAYLIGLSNYDISSLLLFLIALSKVIALPTIVLEIVVALSCSIAILEKITIFKGYQTLFRQLYINLKF